MRALQAEGIVAVCAKIKRSTTPGRSTTPVESVRSECEYVTSRHENLHPSLHGQLVRRIQPRTSLEQVCMGSWTVARVLGTLALAMAAGAAGAGAPRRTSASSCGQDPRAWSPLHAHLRQGIPPGRRLASRDIGAALSPRRFDQTLRPDSAGRTDATVDLRGRPGAMMAWWASASPPEGSGSPAATHFDASPVLAASPAACGLVQLPSSGRAAQPIAILTAGVGGTGRFGAAVTVRWAEVSGPQSEALAAVGCVAAVPPSSMAAVPAPSGSADDAAATQAAGSASDARSLVHDVGSSLAAHAAASQGQQQGPAAPVVWETDDPSAAVGTLSLLATHVSVCPDTASASLGPGDEATAQLEITNLRSDLPASARVFRLDSGVAASENAAAQVVRALLGWGGGVPTAGLSASFHGGDAPLNSSAAAAAVSRVAGLVASASAPAWLGVTSDASAALSPFSSPPLGNATAGVATLEAAVPSLTAAPPGATVPVTLASDPPPDRTIPVSPGSTASVVLRMRYGMDAPGAMAAAAASPPGALLGTVVVWFPWGEARVVRATMRPRVGPASPRTSTLRAVVTADADAGRGVCGESSTADEVARLGSDAASLLGLGPGAASPVVSRSRPAGGGNALPASSASSLVVARPGLAPLAVAVLRLRDAFGNDRPCGADAAAAAPRLLSAPDVALRLAALRLAPTGGAEVTLTAAGAGRYVAWLAPPSNGTFVLASPLTSPPLLRVAVLSPVCCRPAVAPAPSGVGCACAAGYGGLAAAAVRPLVGVPSWLPLPPSAYTGSQAVTAAGPAASACDAVRRGLPGQPSDADVDTELDRVASPALNQAGGATCRACPEGTSRSGPGSGPCKRCAAGTFSPGGGDLGARCWRCDAGAASLDASCADGRLTLPSAGAWWHGSAAVTAPAARAVGDDVIEGLGGVAFHPCPAEGACPGVRLCAADRDPSTGLPAGAAAALASGRLPAVVLLQPAVKTLRPLSSFAWEAVPAVVVPASAVEAELLRLGNVSAEEAASRAADCDVTPAVILRAAEAALVAPATAQPLGRARRLAAAVLPSGIDVLDSGVVVSNATLALRLLQAVLASIAGRAPSASGRIVVALPGGAGAAVLSPFRASAELSSWRRQQGTCAEGHSGPLCSICEPGWASAGFGRCSPCLSEPWMNWALLSGAAAGLALFATWWISRRVTRRRLRTTASGAQRILLSFLQVLAIVTDLRTRMPRAVAGLSQVASAAGDGVSLNLYPVQCALGIGFYEELYAYVALPVAMFVLAGVVVFGCCYPCGGCSNKRRPASQGKRAGTDAHGAAEDEAALVLASVSKGDSKAEAGDGAGRMVANPMARRGGGGGAGEEEDDDSLGSEEGEEDGPPPEDSACQRYSDLWVAAGVVLVFLVYSRVFRALVDVFVPYPYPLDGFVRLQADLRVRADTTEHALAQVVAGAAIAGYAIGIPAVFVSFLCHNRARLYPPTDDGVAASREALAERLRAHSFFTRFSFAYDGTRPGLFWWEAVVLVRKVAVALCAALLRDPAVQAYGASVVLALSLVLHLHVKPYVLYGLNALEAVSLAASLVALFGSTVFWRLDADAAAGAMTPEEFATRELVIVAALAAGLGLTALLLVSAMCGGVVVKLGSACCGAGRVEFVLDAVDTCCRHRSVQKRARGAGTARPGAAGGSGAAGRKKAGAATGVGAAGSVRAGRGLVADRLLWGGGPAKIKAGKRSASRKKKP